jgi:hypothetical protein
MAPVLAWADQADPVCSTWIPQRLGDLKNHQILLCEHATLLDAPHLTIEQTRQIAALQKAGKSASEIMTIMGLPWVTMEEIKQRLLDEILLPDTTA